MKKIFTSNSTGRWIIFWTMVCSALINNPAQANNIRINAPVKVSAGTGDTLVLEFPLQWDNSWRDEFNWDAAWVFLKYKVGTGDWKHVPLSFGGHSFNGSSGQPVHFDYMPGQTGSNTLGLFVYRSKSESGNTPEIICKLKCLKSTLGGMDAGKFDKHEAFIRAQGVEMVYVPYGAYYLGDNASDRSFTGIEKNLYGSIPESSDIVNNTSGYTITASHAYYPALNAADHQNNPVYPTGSWYTNTTASCWWKIDFKTAKTVRYFGVSGATNYPTYAPNGVWHLEGSNDDAAWTTLSAVDPGVWRATTTSYPVQQSIRVADPGAYRYYRLNFPKNYHTMVQNIAMTEDNLFTGGPAWGDLVDSESGRSFLVDGNDITIPDAFPKGYKGFYTMKYELSQEQYVAFLNTLTYAQQQERVPGLASMKEGDYIFGDHSQPSNRNGICVAVASFNNQPVIFANNLTNDGKYAQDNDGKTIACNYLSPNDMLSYCSWSGLRPMSELEYEKTCRPIYPDPVVVKGYAWSTTNVPGRLSSVNNGGQRNEVSGTNGANVNAGNTFGPVRCGLFATSASNQQAAGATFWGVMEMSGNLRELCYNIGAASTFNGSVLGDGSYSLTAWNNTITNFGVRGGGFSSGDSLLRVSDRTEVTGYFAGMEQHDSTVTFRGVYPIAGAVDAGTIEVVKACPDNIEIKSVTDASSKFALSYLWYVLRPGRSVWEMLPGETGAVISGYDVMSELGTAVSMVYKFKRKAVALVGEATTAEVSLTVSNMKLTLNDDEVFLDLCNISNKTIIATVATGNCQWYYKNNLLPVSGNNYIADRSHFGDESKTGGVFTVVCRYSASGCQTEQSLVVHVAPDNLTCPSTVQDIEGNIYPTIKIDCQCWMNKNLNVGTFTNTSDPWNFNKSGIQKWCSANTIANCDKYGGLYEWWEVVCNGMCNNLTVAQAENISPADETQLAQYGAKMTPDGARIQGICPDGWHIPTQTEWNVLIANGNFGPIPNGGCWSHYDNAFYPMTGFWSSQPYGSVGAHIAWTMTPGNGALMIGGYINSFYSYTNYRSYGHHVRCLKN